MSEEISAPPPPPRRAVWPYLLVGLVVVVLAVAFWPRKQSSEPAESPQARRTPWSGATASVEERSVAETQELSGTLEPQRRAILATRLSGRILELSLEEGDKVYAGQLVARVDTSDLESRTAQARAGELVAQAGTAQADASVRTARSGLEQARAQVKALESQRGEVQARLELARTDDRRQSLLFEEGAISQQEAQRARADYLVARSQSEQLEANLKRAQAGVAAASARLEEASTGVSSSEAMVAQARAGTAAAASDLSYGTIVAPFPGVVTQKLLRQGEMATPGAPVVEIQDLYHLQLVVAVPEEQLDRVKVGQTMSLEVGGRKLSGRVRQRVPAADPASRSFTAKIAVENPRGELIPGMFGRLALPVGQRKALYLPQKALTRRGQLEEVLVIAADGAADLRLVKTGRIQGDQVEILSGLAAGERVALP